MPTNQSDSFAQCTENVFPNGWDINVLFSWWHVQIILTKLKFLCVLVVVAPHPSETNKENTAQK